MVTTETNLLNRNCVSVGESDGNRFGNPTSGGGVFGPSSRVLLESIRAGGREELVPPRKMALKPRFGRPGLSF